MECLSFLILIYMFDILTDILNKLKLSNINNNYYEHLIDFVVFNQYCIFHVYY